MKNLGNYHNLYVQSDTLLLRNVLENFRNKCIDIHELDTAILFCTRISMVSLFKKDRNKIRIINKYCYVVNS